MTEKTLHSMTDELLDVLGEISEAEGVLTEEQEERLDSVRMNRKEKINRLLNFIEYEESLARGLADEIKSRQRLKRIRENTVKGLKRYLLRELRRSGDRSVETAGEVPLWCRSGLDIRI